MAPKSEHDPRGGAIVWPILAGLIIAGIFLLAHAVGVK